MNGSEIELIAKLVDEDHVDEAITVAKFIESKKKKKLDPAALKLGAAVIKKIERPLVKALEKYYKQLTGETLDYPEIEQSLPRMQENLTRSIAGQISREAKMHKPRSQVVKEYKEKKKKEKESYFR